MINILVHKLIFFHYFLEQSPRNGVVGSKMTCFHLLLHFAKLQLWCRSLLGLRSCGCGCGIGQQLQLQFDPYAMSAALKRPEKKEKNYWEFSLWLSRLRTWLVSMRMHVQSLTLLTGLRIWHCHKLWCCGYGVGWQHSSDLTPSPETSICRRCDC